MKKTKTFIISALAALLLTSCSLFNDKDMEYLNKYNPPKFEESQQEQGEESVAGVESTVVPGTGETLAFKNIYYGTDAGEVENTYGVGGVNHTLYDVNNHENYYANAANNNFDLYVPKSAIAKKDQKQTVVLFIHGGAWISGLKTDVNSYVHSFAKEGYIAATPKYTLLKKEMDDPSLSIFRDLDEIHAVIGKMKSCLADLGFDTSKLNLAIGGASSGAHLAMLYAYSRKDPSPIPVKFVIDAVGPTDIQKDAWKSFVNASDEVLDAGITASAIAAQASASNIKELEVSGQGYNWNTYQTMKIANGMCGMPFSLDTVKAASTDEEHISDTSNVAYQSIAVESGSGLKGERLLSVTDAIKSASVKHPILCAYSGKDNVVGINQYATLEPVLNSNSVEHDFVYFRDAGHTDLEKFEETFSEFKTKIINWLAADSI